MNTSANPLITVVMAVYNCAEFLAQSLQSVIDQTEDDFEFLVLDDGSTDRSRDVIESYCKLDRRVRCVEHPDGRNHGLSVSLNALIDQARGRFIARMDGDDVCCPERFRDQLRFLQSHPDVVAVGCQCEVIDRSGQRVGRIRRAETHHEIEHQFFNGGGGIMHPAAMIRTDNIRQIGGYDPSLRYAQDLDLFLRLGEIGRLANLSAIGLQYRWHDGQISVGKRSRQLICVAAALSKAAKRRHISVAKQLSEIYAELAWRLRIEGKRFSAFSYACRLLAIDPVQSRAWRYLATSLLGRRRHLQAIVIEPEGREVCTSV